MKSIGDLFLKYKNLITSQSQIKIDVASCVNKFLKSEIGPDNIIIKNKKISFKISPIQKQELFLHREELEREIKEKIPTLIL